jgi:hypothetical protein
MLLPLITLALGPWRGPSLPSATPNATKYKLTVRGPADRKVDLRADGLPKGWVASFCTSTECSPFEYEMELNDRGTGVIEFQAIRTDDSAPPHVHVTITTNGAKPVDVAI